MKLLTHLLLTSSGSNSSSFMADQLTGDKFEFIANTSKEFMTLINLDYIYEAANSAYLFAHGKQRGEVLGKTIKEIWGEDIFDEKIKPALQQSFAGSEIEYESWFPFPELGKRCFEVRQYPYKNEKGKVTHVAVVSRDITERKEAQSKLMFIAYHDELTGLKNLKRLTLDLDALFATGEHKSIQLFNIYLNNIKSINDTLGYAIGDSIIQESAKRLLALLGNQGDVYRISGSAFAIVNKNKPEKDNDIVTKILYELTNPFRLTKYDYQNTAIMSLNIGIAQYPEHGQDADSLIKHSNLALHQAIESGHDNFIFYSESVDIKLSKNIQIEKDLQEALQKENFILHYQPKVNQQSEIVAMEALIRWMHPQNGLISPLDFIPLAEKTGLIAPIGLWVLKEATRFNKELSNKGKKPLVVAVNLSPFQFSDPHLLENVKVALEESKLPPHLLELEITESGAMENISKSLEILNEFRSMGIKLSIDDFGTGFSSLSNLSLFPIDTLKIDKSFVDNVPGDVQSMITITSIINLSQNLGFKVVVEGVETKEQFDYLLSVGCREFQGFYFSKPLPGDNFIEKNLQ